jgi:hypothetical protein
MFGDKELHDQIRDHEARLGIEELKYVEAVRSHKNYDTLRAIRNDIRDIKQELETLYSMQDKTRQG